MNKFTLLYKRVDDFVFTLVIGPNGSQQDIDEWAEGAKYTKEEFTSLSSAMHRAHNLHPLRCRVRGVLNLGPIDSVDMDVLVAGKSA